MGSTQPTKTAKEYAKRAATLAASTKRKPRGSMPLGASPSLSPITTATTLTASPKTLTSVELAALQSKAGLVAGALRDFQDAKGIVVHRNLTYTLASGRKLDAVKVIMFAENISLVADQTADGLDFRLVAEEGKE